MNENLQELYQNCIEQLDAEEILLHYGARNIRRISGRSGVEFNHSCIIDKVIPHHNNGDENPSAMMNTEKLLYNCFSFGGGDIFWLIQQMEQTEDSTVVRNVLSKFLQGTSQNQRTLIDRLEEIFKQRGKEVKVEIPHYNEKVLRPWLKLHPYLYSDRGISVDVLRKYNIGYDESEARIVIPHYYCGKLVGWQKRKMNVCGYPKSDGKIFGMQYIPKYQSSSGFPRSETLYNFDQVNNSCEPVIVVESPLSVLKLLTVSSNEIIEDKEVEKILSRPVATFGAKVTEDQIKLLRKFDKVVVFFDSDLAGWQGALKLVKGLRKYTEVTCVVDGKLVGDPGEIPAPEIIRLLSNTTPSIIAVIDLQEAIQRTMKEKNNEFQKARIF